MAKLRKLWSTLNRWWTPSMGPDEIRMRIRAMMEADMAGHHDLAEAHRSALPKWVWVLIVVVVGSEFWLHELVGLVKRGRR